MPQLRSQRSTDQADSAPPAEYRRSGRNRQTQQQSQNIHRRTTNHQESSNDASSSSSHHHHQAPPPPPQGSPSVNPQAFDQLDLDSELPDQEFNFPSLGSFGAPSSSVEEPSSAAVPSPPRRPPSPRGGRSSSSSSHAYHGYPPHPHHGYYPPPPPPHHGNSSSSGRRTSPSEGASSSSGRAGTSSQQPRPPHHYYYHHHPPPPQGASRDGGERYPARSSTGSGRERASASYPPPPYGYPPYHPPPHRSSSGQGGSGAQQQQQPYPPHPAYPYGYEGASSWEHFPPSWEEDDIPPPPPATAGSSNNKTTPRPSPFRTPGGAASNTPQAMYRKSPYNSPYIGMSGSFGIDTPMGAKLPNEFSPMEAPTFHPMDDFRTEGYTTTESLLSGVPRSPVRNNGASSYEAAPSSTQRLYHHHPTNPVVTVSDRNKASSRPPASSPALHTKPRKLWPDPNLNATQPATGASSPAISMKLGVTGGTGSLGSRKSLGEINSMMQKNSSTAKSSSASKAPPQRPSSAASHAAASAAKFKFGQRMNYSSKTGVGGATPFSSAVNSSKENNLNDKKLDNSGGSGKKAKKPACYCKKSKCLKLYCECFAAERFCDGCSCNDCGNTPTAGAARDKAIKETRAKNPNAFKPRIGNSKQSTVIVASPSTTHNMGCKCKKSECLKKYCECFQAGVICGGKCKCIDCQNYAGSQMLIDKRRKIKDQRGADFAMRVADEAWKSGAGGAARKPPHQATPQRQTPSQAPAGARRLGPPPPITSPAGANGMAGRPPHMFPSPGNPYHMPGMMMGAMGMGPMAYSPMGMPMTPAGYPPHGAPPMQQSGYAPPASASRSKKTAPTPTTAAKSKTEGDDKNTTTAATAAVDESTASAKKRPASAITATPRTPGVRVAFDPQSSRKKRKIGPGKEEPTEVHFGDSLPKQPKTTALAILSFLSNEDLFNAGLVTKQWSSLAMDEELWKFQEA